MAADLDGWVLGTHKIEQLAVCLAGEPGAETGAWDLAAPPARYLGQDAGTHQVHYLPLVAAGEPEDLGERHDAGRCRRSATARTVKPAGLERPAGDETGAGAVALGVDLQPAGQCGRAGRRC